MAPMTSSAHEESAGTETVLPPADTVVVPADEDPVAAAGSELLGGPPGRRALLGVSWWTPGRVLALIVIAVFALGMVQKSPCYSSGWFFGATTQYTHACYSDIPHLFSGRGFAQGLLHKDMIPAGADGTRDPNMQYLEYPVLTGLFMQIATWLTPRSGNLVPDREQWFWMVNAGMLMICAVVAVIAVMRTHRRRPWDALLFALAPALALNATVNWDLLAVALTAMAMAYWSARRPVGAGVLIGLATAAKLYPVLLLLPLLVLCLRAGRMRDFSRAAAAAVGAWLLVDVPVMLWNSDGWWTFYKFSSTRKEDFGSFWLIIQELRGQSLGPWLNILIAALMILSCAGIVWLALSAPHRPRFAQLAFLVVAAFVLTNKVYSPQYVLWLIPLAALARPRWRDFLIWQSCEVVYFLGVWMYLAYISDSKQHGLSEPWYRLVILVHIFGTLYLCALVVRDILLPDRDPVRWDGSDDPSGGVLDGAPDRFVLGEARWIKEQATYAPYAPAGGGPEDWLAPQGTEKPAL
ncbi:glycosyltransferase family 87 protein [Peterkaempfera sp. SMS 1(5)a]